VRLTRRLAASSQKDEKDECATAGEELSEEPRLVPLVAASIPEEEEQKPAVLTVSYKQVSLSKYLSFSCVHSECAGAGYIGSLNKRTYSDRLNFNLPRFSSQAVLKTFVRGAYCSVVEYTQGSLFLMVLNQSVLQTRSPRLRLFSLLSIRRRMVRFG
jgi:hypothetical protein